MHTQKFSRRLSYTLARALVLMSLGVALVASAHNKVVVIPLGGGEAQRLSNVVTVAKSNGDFSDPIAALNSITDASESNPYLVVIAPGVYTLSGQLQMKEWVSIAGSGRYVTKLTGAVSTASQNCLSGFLLGADNAELSDISIENTGISDHSIAICIDDVSPTLERVNAIATGSSANSAYGILTRNSLALPIINNTRASAEGAANSYGIYNRSGSSPTITNVHAMGTGGTNNNYGVFVNGSFPTINSSVLTGTTGGLYLSDNPPPPDPDVSTNSRVTNTKIIGGIDSDPAGTQCRNTYDENLADVPC